MCYKLDVVDRDSLDEASQALHPKPWLVCIFRPIVTAHSV